MNDNLNGVKIRTITIREYYDLVEAGKINSNAAYQRPIKAAWMKAEQMDSFIDSILKGFPMPPLFVISKDGIFYLVDGVQRTAAITSNMRGLYKSVEFDAFATWDKEKSESYLNYELMLYELNDMDEEAIVTLFQRLQRGIPLTHLEVKRSAILSQIELLADSIKIMQSITGYGRSECEAVLLQTACMLAGQFEVKSKAMVEFLIAHPIDITLSQTILGKVKLLESILKVEAGAVWESARKRFLKKIHVQTLLTVIEGNENPADINLSILTFFDQMADRRSDSKIAYNQACASNTAAADNVLVRIDCMTKVLNNDESCKAKIAVKPIKEAAVKAKEAAAESPNKGINQAAVNSTTAESVKKLDSVIVENGKKVTGFNKKHGRK